MPTFNKSRGFKLKSGNTIPFKEMGSSPVLQQADASLVAAAKAAAMANVPKDMSAQINQTADAVKAAGSAKTEMLKTAAKELPGVAIAASRGIVKAVKKSKSRIKARKDAGYKGKFGNIPADKKDRASLGKKAGWDTGAVATRKANRLARQEINEAANIKFEKDYKIEHKDRISIADIREMTGATPPRKKRSKKETKSEKKLRKANERLALQDKTGDPAIDEAVIGWEGERV